MRAVTEASFVDDNQVEVFARNIFTRKVNRMIFTVSRSKWAAAEKAYNSGALIQNAFRFLNADEREFLMTGMTPEESAAIFKEGNLN